MSKEEEANAVIWVFEDGELWEGGEPTLVYLTAAEIDRLDEGATISDMDERFPVWVMEDGNTYSQHPPVELELTQEQYAEIEGGIYPRQMFPEKF